MSSSDRQLELFKYYCARTGERVNYNKAKWAIRDLLVTYEYDELVNLINYYVDNSTQPQWKKFSNNIEQVAQRYDSAVADKQRRQKLREETLRLVEDERGSRTTIGSS